MTADKDLSDAVDERLGRLVELARRRTESRRRLRAQLDERRTAGLSQRHQTKLNRTGERE